MARLSFARRMLREAGLLRTHRSGLLSNRERHEGILCLVALGAPAFLRSRVRSVTGAPLRQIIWIRSKAFAAEGRPPIT